MVYRCDPGLDLPAPHKAKRVIFYRHGLKVYGELPYLLKKRLKAEFYSNFAVNGGFGMIAPAVEPNYSVIPCGQPPDRSMALLDWLFADAGFEWAIAIDYDRDIRCSTAFSGSLPQCWVPANNEGGWRKGFIEAMAGQESATLNPLISPATEIG